VARVGLPLMVLAAALGALAVASIPQSGLYAPATIGRILLVALAGAFLPVPMAFDCGDCVCGDVAWSGVAVCGNDPVHGGNLQRVLVFGGGQNHFMEDCGGGRRRSRGVGRVGGDYRNGIAVSARKSF